MLGLKSFAPVDVTITHNTVADKGNGYCSTGLCQGSCFPVDCMPTDKIKLSMFYSAAQRKMYYPGQTNVVVCPFVFFSSFFTEKKKYLFSNLGLCPSFVYGILLLVF